MRYIVGSSDIADVEAAVKEHGAESVYWLTDSTRSRDATRAGLDRNHLLSVQNLGSMEATLELFGEGWSEYSAKPAPKPKAKKSAKKDE
tara:strand:+ start:896 stop:1162 length:267 start_codon:yes stop_codon:yes gene_type:complete